MNLWTDKDMQDMTDAELDAELERVRAGLSAARALYDALCEEKTLRRIEGRNSP